MRFAQAEGEASLAVINQYIHPHPTSLGDRVCRGADQGATFIFIALSSSSYFGDLGLLFSSRMLQKPVWREVIIVLVFMGPWVPASSLLVKVFRASESSSGHEAGCKPGCPNHRWICRWFSLCPCCLFKAAHIDNELLRCSECRVGPQKRDEEGQSYFLGTRGIKKKPFVNHPGTSGSFFHLPLSVAHPLQLIGCPFSSAAAAI